jgi:hypothetical protein
MRATLHGGHFARDLAERCTSRRVLTGGLVGGLTDCDAGAERNVGVTTCG